LLIIFQNLNGVVDLSHLISLILAEVEMCHKAGSFFRRTGTTPGDLIDLIPRLSGPEHCFLSRYHTLLPVMSRHSGFLVIASNELALMPGVEPMEFFSSLEAELSARSAWMPNIDSLEFINDPAKSGPYQRQTPDLLKQPNVGLYALKPTPKNHIFLEHENRLCDILHALESMEATEARECMEDRVIRELSRINRLKEIEWSGQRSKFGIKGAVVNTGMFISSRCGRCSS
jgi:hypothetical protein